MMKLVLALVTVLAIFGRGQAHRFPDFGKGPLHEDIQDLLDLIPTDEIGEVFMDYWTHDSEVNYIVNMLRKNPSVIKNLWQDFQSIPELLKLLNYMEEKDVEIYHVINLVNVALNIPPLQPPTTTPTPTTTSTTSTTSKPPSTLPTSTPPSSTSTTSSKPTAYSMTMKRTGGLAGFVKDVKALFSYDDIMAVYVNKIRDSNVFINFIEQIKSENFQQFVNKFYQKNSLQIILRILRFHEVNTRFVRDIIYLVLGITIPDMPLKTLQEELLDFVKLIPAEQFLDIILKYVNEDEQVKNALKYMFTPDFHTLVRAIEALKEHQALVVFVQKAGIDVIEAIQEFHKAIGMEDYVPPKLESLLTHTAGLQKVGDGMKGLLKELWDILPLKEIDALYKEKMNTSKVFAEFIAKMTSQEMQKIITNLHNNLIYKTVLMKTRIKGLELEGFTELATRIFGLKFPKHATF